MYTYKPENGCAKLLGTFIGQVIHTLSVIALICYFTELTWTWNFIIWVIFAELGIAVIMILLIFLFSFFWVMFN